MNFSIFINSLCLSLTSIGILLCLIFISLIVFCIRPLKSNIPLILTCNTYLASLISSIIVFRTDVQTIVGILHSITSYQGFSCQINGYILYVGLGNVFYSYILQAIFRLLRIVFYRQKSLYSGRVFSILILIQWILSFLLNLPFILFGDMQYIPSEHRCQVAYTNTRGCLMVLFIGYLIPGNLMFTIYFYIIRYLRRTNNRTIHRHDMTIFKKTFIIFTTVQLLSIPLSVLWLMYIIANYLTPLSYQIQALTIAFSQSFMPIILAYSTPQIRGKFKQRRRQQRWIHPVVQERFPRNGRSLQERF